jgi:dTDP-4-amino-4,6-dideoxygalactose transaminase
MTRKPPDPRRREGYVTFGAPRIGDAEVAELLDSLRSGWIGSGPKVTRFEQLIGGYTEARHAVAVGSCTAGLHLALRAAGVGPGDEVITTAMTFAATANAIIHAGATPVLVDCHRDTGLIDVERVEAAITPRTRAVIPVHLTGRACDLDALMELTARRGLLLLEDGAHALETRWKGRKIGSVGQMTCFSFYVTKNITTGEGGMVTTDVPEYAAAIRTYANHGLDKDAWKRYGDSGFQHYAVTVAGYKANLTDMQAALGIHQFAQIEPWLRRRERIWQHYDAEFADLPVMTPPPAEPDTVHARHLYTLMIDPERAGTTRDAFMRALHELGIGTGVHYVGVHLHPYYRETFGYRPEQFPAATWISERTVSLPLSPHLDDSTVERIVDAVRGTLSD